MKRWEVYGHKDIHEYMGWLFMNGEETAADEILANNPEFGMVSEKSKVKEKLKTGDVVYESV